MAFRARRRHIEPVLLFARRIPSRKPVFPQRIVFRVWAGVARLLEMEGDTPFALDLSGIVRSGRVPSSSSIATWANPVP